MSTGKIIYAFILIFVVIGIFGTMIRYTQGIEAATLYALVMVFVMLVAVIYLSIKHRNE